MSKYNIEVLTAFTYLQPKKLRGFFGDTTSRDFFSIWFLTNGQGEIKIEDEIFLPEIGDCFLFPPEAKRQINPNKLNPFIPLVIHFTPLDNKKYFFKHKRFKDSFFFRELLNRILSAHQRKDNVAANDWLSVALMELLEKEVKNIEIFHGTKFEYISEIGHICNKIKKSPELKWDVEKLAHEIFISKQHFYRLFKELHNCSPQQFITNAKMKKAERLLTYSAYGITEIANILGYSYQTQFFRDFKKKYKITAKEFREQNSYTLKG